MTRKYWKGIDELKETPEFIESKHREFPQELPVDEFLADEQVGEASTGRRDFLKFLGFSVAAATVAACEAPVTKAIPYVNKPENVTPGLATWYASTYYDGDSYASILVKTREGRPIFIKGNRDFGVTGGSVNPQIAASVLTMYDSERLREPSISGNAASYKDVDGQIKDALLKANKTVLVSNTVISPSALSAINELRLSVGEEKFEHIQYDAVSYAAMRKANEKSFGMSVIPDYDFSKAKTIVSVGADFLSSWLFPTRFAPHYGLRRKPEGEWMSKHFQFESVLSVTGTNADGRAMIKPSEEYKVLAYMLSKLGSSVAGASIDLSADVKAVADEALKSLRETQAESIVIAGSNDVSNQILANKINDILGTYSKTINLNEPLNLYQSNDAAMSGLVKDVIAGKGPDVLVFLGTNPVYTLPEGVAFGDALKNVGTTISMALFMDETASKCKYSVPDLHMLESWMDHQVSKTHYALAQPTIRPLYNTASAIETFLVWAGKAGRGGKDSKVAYKYIQKNWELYGFPMQTEYTDFQTYWNMMVHNGSMNEMAAEPAAVAFIPEALSGLKFPKTSTREVILYQKAGIGIGAQANNPWLQEMPDPISKVTWDNYITMNPVEMEKEGYPTTFDQENGLGLAKITVSGESFELPVYPLPGQAPGTVGVALGYGRGQGGEKIGKAAYQTYQYGGHIAKADGLPTPIGANAFRFVNHKNGTYSYFAGCSVSKIAGSYQIAATQIHHTVMGRHSIVRETTLDVFKSADKDAYNPAHMLEKMDEHGHHVAAPISEFNLWDEHPVEHIGHRWGMAIDLSSCIGCGSCLIACQVENNVPVVGKDEVRRGREMHWLRIDRYFASDEEATVGQRKDKDTFNFGKAEKAALNPRVVHMPMMCHHCNHAPCETVCPVAATTHSNEGLNQMAYNRCIGTRYCANNCPYKVRRFNWFNYPSYKAQREINPAQDDVGRMVLNPDVTVRTRGVMEKCSFCVQRIQEVKLDAKAEGRPVLDGELSFACSDVCPTSAITVGDWNDVKSSIRKTSEDKRAYIALEEVGVKPNVWYQVKVRNEHNELLNTIQTATAHHGETQGEKKQH